VALGLFAPAAFAGNCSTNTPLSLATPGHNPLITPGGVVDQIAQNGGTGTANLSGTANCPDTDLSDTHALAAALSNPIWLETGENFAISGGVGFSDGSGAFGATGLMRFDRNVSGFAGGALVDDDTWAGKAGVRVGW
jgi:hypothetical protein